MYRLGYDFIVASEMSSLNTEYSTLFFKHSGIPEGHRIGLVFKGIMSHCTRWNWWIFISYMVPMRNNIKSTLLFLVDKLSINSFISRSLPLMCIAPLGKDALECLRYTDNVEKSVRNVISTSWPPGKTQRRITN